MMKKGTLLLFMLLLGCKSISDIRQNKPDWIFKSEKPVDQVAECIFYGWEESRGIFGIPYGAFMQPFPKGKTVYIDGYFAVADVSSLDEKNTSVKLYLPKGELWLPVVKQCI